MIEVKVAWSRQAADIAETDGFERLQKGVRGIKKGYDWDIYTFRNMEIADAFTLGVTHSGGWDSPYWEKDTKRNEDGKS